MIATAYSLFLRRELPAKQTFVLALASLIPAGITLLVRLVFGGGKEFIEATGAPLTLYGPAVLVPIFYAVPAFHEEFESRTIVYLLTRPPTRASYVIGKFLTAWTCSALAITLGILVMGLVAGWNQGAPDYFAAITGKLLVVSWLSCAVYSSLFLVFGMWLKNPVIYGLIFTFGWEYLVAILPGQLQDWTVGMYPKALFIRWANSDPVPFFPWMSRGSGEANPAISALNAAIESPDLEIPSLLVCAIVIPAMTLAFLAIAILIFRQREDA
jgi:ABC-type transport system involved in multi-copper enzyme maturation permease subunit